MKTIRFACGVLCALITGASQAARWEVSSHGARRGERVVVTVTMSGDGRTAAADLSLVFDEARLALPADGLHAESPHAWCARAASNRIGLLFLPPPDELIPAGEYPACTLSFEVPAQAPNGFAEIDQIDANCSILTGAASACDVVADGHYVVRAFPVGVT